MPFQHNSIVMEIRPPKQFKSTEIASFFIRCEKIFKLKGANERNFILRLSEVKKVSLLGALIVYKVVEYTVENSCFDRPIIDLDMSSEMAYSLKKYGFTELILSYIENRHDVGKQLKSLRVSIDDRFIIAPQALLRADKKSREEINKKYLPQIQSYYSGNDRAVQMILLVFSEILLNFWEHAVNDSTSIIVAHGTKDSIEIACADTGNGIVTTLGTTLSAQSLRPEQVLLKAMEKGVTSKEMTNHMGYGLWILDSITTMVKGRLHIYSQGAYFYNEFSKRRSGTCGYWQGTIVSITLPLSSPKTLSDIETEGISTSIKINWV